MYILLLLKIPYFSGKIQGWSAELTGLHTFIIVKYLSFIVPSELYLLRNYRTRTTVFQIFIILETWVWSWIKFKYDQSGRCYLHSILVVVRTWWNSIYYHDRIIRSYFATWSYLFLIKKLSSKIPSITKYSRTTNILFFDEPVENQYLLSNFDVFQSYIVLKNYLLICCEF